MRKRTLAREAALQILYAQEMNPQELPELFELWWTEHSDTDSEIREFAEEIVSGTCHYLKDLDLAIEKAAVNWDLHRMAILDKLILRLATYELLFRHDIPPKVTINEAVNLAKKFSQEESGKFVNGVIDKISHSENVRFGDLHVPKSSLQMD